MSRFAQPLTQLIDELSKLPGIGRKSAQRLAFHILRATEQDAFALADAIRDMKAQLHLCSICHNITDVDPCQFCSNPSRNQAVICVVEEPSNIASIERTKHFNGTYHVLHGTLSPLNGIGPDQLRIDSLVERVQAGSLQEVILADQSHCRRRGHRRLSAAIAARNASSHHQNCHRHPGRS